MKKGDKLIPMIQQIALANESCSGGLIVILTTLPKEELEYTIHEAAIDLKGTGKLSHIFNIFLN